MKKGIVIIYRDLTVMKFEHDEKMTKKQKLKVGKQLAKILDEKCIPVYGIDDLEIIYKDKP